MYHFQGTRGDTIILNMFKVISMIFLDLTICICLHVIDADTNVMVQKIFGRLTQSPKAAHMWPIPLQVKPSNSNFN